MLIEWSLFMYAYNLLELNHSILLMLFCALDGLYVPLSFFLLLSLVMPYVICFIVGFMYLSAFACLPVVRNVICLITCRTLCYWPQCAFRLLLSIYARCHILGVRPLCAFRLFYYFLIHALSSGLYVPFGFYYWLIYAQCHVFFAWPLM